MRSVHAVPARCGFRPASAADGRGIPASFKARLIRAALCPASRCANIHATTGAVTGSGSSLCARRPHAAWILFGCGPASARRRPDAREQLRAAHDMFAAIGMEAFAERARVELAATGETIRRRTADTHGELTPQEAQVARLARAGLSNPEIATQLFLSPRTVEYHLGKVSAKLEITSRRQLRQALPDSLS